MHGQAETFRSLDLINWHNLLSAGHLGGAAWLRTVGELDITDELIAERRAEEAGPNAGRHDALACVPITAFIDVIERCGPARIICLLLVPLIMAMVFEVVSRNMFAIATDRLQRA